MKFLMHVPVVVPPVESAKMIRQSQVLKLGFGVGRVPRALTGDFVVVKKVLNGMQRTKFVGLAAVVPPVVVRGPTNTKTVRVIVWIEKTVSRPVIFPARRLNRNGTLVKGCVVKILSGNVILTDLP